MSYRPEYHVRYNRSPRGIARRRRYYRSEARRQCTHRYNTGPAGHAAQARYRAKASTREQRNWVQNSRRRARRMRERAL